MIRLFEIIVGTVGAVVGIAGMVFGAITLSKNKMAENKNEGKEDGVVLTTLGYIKKGIEGIEHRLERQENQYIDVIAKLATVESSAKQAHKRIDALEEYHKPH